MTSALDVLNGFLDLVYPPKCFACGALGGKALCDGCRDGFRAVPRPICRHCGNYRDEKYCRGCRSYPASHLAGARSAGVFEGSLRNAILRLKYTGRRNLAGPLGVFLSDYLSRRPFGRVQFDVIVPVPLHRSKLVERGFNQSALIAGEVGRNLSLPVAEECVIRVRRTRPQVDLHASERAANVNGAFRVADMDKVAGRTVLLVDDVATTLSTGNACAEALVEGGAKAVYLATVGRELFHGNESAGANVPKGARRNGR